MEINRILEFSLDREEAIALQKKYAKEVIECPAEDNIKLIAGIDGSYPPKTNKGYVAIVVIERESGKVIEEATWKGDINFPYIPGLLSLREVPGMLEAFRKLQNVPDLVIVDGNGRIHPRKFGLACHMGLCLGIPTIGCAKNPFVGEHDELPNERGAIADLKFEGEVIGKVIRSQVNATPLYVSVGHLFDLDLGTQIVSSLTSKSNRHPLPVFLAHTLCTKIRKQPT